MPLKYLTAKYFGSPKDQEKIRRKEERERLEQLQIEQQGTNTFDDPRTQRRDTQKIKIELASPDKKKRGDKQALY